MLPSKMSTLAIMRPGMVRSLPARSIRAHASASADNTMDTVTTLGKEVVEAATATATDVVPDLPLAVTPESPQPPTPNVSSAPSKAIPDVSPTDVAKPSDLPKSSVPEISGQEQLDMSDILPDVKAPDLDASVAGKVESMFSKASSMFQKIQPEPTPAPGVELPAPSLEPSIPNFSGMLDSIKEATNEMAPAPKPVAPPSSVPSTPAPSMPSLPQMPAIDSGASKAQTLQEAVKSAPATDAAAIPVDSAPMSSAPVVTDPSGPGPLARAMEYTDTMIDRAEDAVNNFIDSATDQAASMMQNVGDGMYNSMPKSLPPNLQPKADMIGDNFVAAKAIYDDAPGVYLLLAALAIGSSAYTYWKFEYGGYKGVYSPVDLLEALNREENVFVVDIRPDEDLKEKGVLDLKRRARGKATHLPLVDVPDAVKGNIDNSQRLQLQLNAALVTSLNEVNRFTKIVVMDSRGTSVKGLARAITQQGYRGYMLGGGFKEWKTGGLAVKFGSYAVTPADLLADKGEELSEAAEETAEKLRQPRNAAFALLTLASAVAVYIYPHESFRLIGVLGIELTILVKLLSYESPSDAVDDVNKGFQTIKDSFFSAKAQATEFAEVAQARSVSTPLPPAPEKPSEPAQKSSPVSEARESVAAEAVKEAQAALERMVAQSKETKPPPVPAPQAMTKPTEKKPAPGKPFVSAAEDSKPTVPKTAESKSADAKPADLQSIASLTSASKPETSKPAEGVAASAESANAKPFASVVTSSKSAQSKKVVPYTASAEPTNAKSTAQTVNTVQSAESKTAGKPAGSKSTLNPAGRADAVQSSGSQNTGQLEETKAGNWPASEKKQEVVPPKPVVDSLPYVSADGKPQKGKDGAKRATNKK